MGTDMHFCVEHKSTNGDWLRVEDIVTNPNGSRSRAHWYNGRSYILFGVLARVRALDVPTLAARRGFPDDASEETRERYVWYKDESRDASGETWYTAEDLVRFDWWQRIPAYVRFNEKASEPARQRAVVALTQNALQDSPITTVSRGEPMPAYQDDWLPVEVPLAYWTHHFQSLILRLVQVDTLDLTATRAVIWFDQWTDPSR